MSAKIATTERNIMNKLRRIGALLLLVAGFTVCASAQKVTLSWVQPAAPSCGPIQGYNVYWSATPNGEVIGTHPLTPTAITGTTFTDPTVTFGITREYKVTTWACNKESVFSNAFTATIPAQIIIIPPPTGLAGQVTIP